MRDYDPGLPLYSIHIPKCGGTSFRNALEGWFGDRFFIHYFQQADAPPERIGALAGSCVHGHFNREKGLGLLDYYPDARQAITILRDPLETAVSNYFFWKNRARERQLRLGVIEEGSEHDYRDIDDFFRKRPLSHMPNFMPCKVTRENVREVIGRYFIFVGLLEEAEASLSLLARLVGRTAPQLEQKNVSRRDETLGSAQREKFVADNVLAFDIYRCGQELFRKLEGRRP